MITLIRPEKSKIADDIEQRLTDMYPAYQVIHKQVSEITYLVESGQVFHGEALIQFLDEKRTRFKKRKRMSSDDKFFD